MRLLITGSRKWSDWRTIEAAIREEVLRVAPEHVVVVHGACPTGADAIADLFAGKMGLEIERHPADWEMLGKAAGPVRNQEMVTAGADRCLAFLMPDSRGTVDCLNRAQRAGIPTRQFRSTGVPTGGPER